MSTISNNPLLWKERIGKWAAIPFDKIKKEHFMPALKFGLEEAEKNIEMIRDNSDLPTFENTVLALEQCSPIVDEVSNIYFNLMGCESDDEFKALAQEIGPLLSQLHNKIMMDEKIFKRVSTIYESKGEHSYTKEELRLIETNYKSFVRNGVQLDDESKKRVLEIDMEMAKLSPQYGQNVLGATNAFELLITDKEELEGLPESAMQAAVYRAKKADKEGWLFNLQFPSIQPILTYAKNRELRKKISLAYGSRAFKDKFDNQEFVKKIAQLRYERASILGYKTLAAYTLEERMAKKPETVHEFIDHLYDAAIPFAKEELKKLKELASEDGIETFESYDFGFYSNLLKMRELQFDQEKIKSYFKMENVVNGLFIVAKKLYGLQFQKNTQLPVYHEDVTVYEVSDEKGNDVGLLYVDLFPRETKRSGAWMTTYLTQGLHHEKIYRPQVSIVANLTPSTDEMPSLLRVDEVKTLFHEFGHALHGLLSDCTYPSLASPNVFWDFVELPSQIMENWAIQKEALDLFAKHYHTDEVIPVELVEKIKKVKNFQAGIQTIRQLGYCLVDMSWHDVNPADISDVGDYEEKVMEKVRLFPKNSDTNLSCSFGHIFGGGYAAGYYSYKWAEVLEADAFELFKQKGIFDKETALSFRDNILSKGNTEHPMDLYVAFRGHQPEPEALLRKAGLISN